MGEVDRRRYVNPRFPSEGGRASHVCYTHLLRMHAGIVYITQIRFRTAQRKGERERETEEVRRSAHNPSSSSSSSPHPHPLSPSVALLPQSDLSSPFPIPEETLTAYRPRARDAGRCRSRRRRAVAVVGDPGSIGHEGRGFDRKDVDLSGSGPRSCFRRRISGRSSGFFENLLNFNDAFLSSDGGLRSWSWAG
ncbi:hypothetical protein B296_00026023 [Ensete ventricosum]|uniref:Uncharacterized protein n=1 Tax=Ensete ventricosum TaxID=4639 RepID=A0A427ASC6_ENSVE|nr:hypothetical protein B296_00026023 [Ensete ventricosum]